MQRGFNLCILFLRELYICSPLILFCFISPCIAFSAALMYLYINSPMTARCAHSGENKRTWLKLYARYNSHLKNSTQRSAAGSMRGKSEKSQFKSMRGKQSRATQTGAGRSGARSEALFPIFAIRQISGSVKFWKIQKNVIYSRSVKFWFFWHYSAFLYSHFVKFRLNELIKNRTAETLKIGWHFGWHFKNDVSPSKMA